MENKIEVWKDIPDYEGLYQVSNLGRVKSLERTIICGTQIRLIKERILKEYKDTLGYCKIGLHKDGKRKTFQVHQLVAKCFLEPIEGKNIVNHKDQNPSNNHVNNLEFCTQQYNVTYNNAHIKRGFNNRGKYKGENNPMYGKQHTEKTKERISKAMKGKPQYKRRKPIQQYTKDMTFIREWDSAKSASMELKIHSGDISKCCKGKLKTVGGFVWRYK